MTPATARLSIKEPAAEIARSRFVADVAEGLAQHPRQIPTRYLYDPLGSTLFDAICLLPWYKITRAETTLLGRHGREILESLRPFTDVVELGPGNGAKLATLLVAHDWVSPLHVHLVDVSRAALDTAARALGTRESMAIVGHQASYEVGLLEFALGRSGRGRALALFLGSNIGNLDPAKAEGFLRVARASLRPGDAAVIGVDLVKPERDLLLAYDDPLGVTAAFNRNLLTRLNRELGATFDLADFAHRAIWNAHASRVDMHLVSARRQRVRIPAASIDIVMREGEPIWTESSYKYRGDQIVSMLERTGFTDCTQWTHDDAQFALTIARV